MLQVAAVKRHGAFTLNADFELPTPGVAALFGRSGCGKTTLINIIAGLLQPDEGYICLDGRVLLDTRQRIQVPPEQRRIGYVFQDARLFPHWNVAGNLRFARRRAGTPQVVDESTLVELLALGPLMQRRTHALSGGERQRVAIARALLAQPQVLLLDEPLASLDAARRGEVLPYLERLRDHLSIPMVYVSHDFNEVLRMATHLVLLEAGRTTAQGDIGAMSLDPGVRAIIGADSVGAVVDGLVLGLDAASGLLRVQIGAGEIKVRPTHAGEQKTAGARLRVQLLARELILATSAPMNLSVRNVLAGTLLQLNSDDADSELAVVDVGGVSILSRITKAASRELALQPGMAVWVLVKTVSLRTHLLTAD